MESKGHVSRRKGPLYQTQSDDKSSGYDIQELKRSPETLPTRSVYPIIIHAIVASAWIYYLGVRFQICRQASSTSPPRTAWSLWLFFICEAIMAAPDVFQMLEFSLWFTPPKNPAPRPVYRLNGSAAPTVHIFITSVCGEDVDVIMDTVAGAAIQDYPKHGFRVLLLDDAGDSRLESAVDNFNKHQSKRLGILPVVYLNRPKKPGIQHYYKAGNLDFGIRTSHEQCGSSEFIAGLDADMIPERDWLKRTVPHLLRSPPDLAMISPPQYSYNLPEGDILAQDAYVLQQVLEPVRDRVGCSMCHGSGYILRREALEAIGGWPQVNLGEDILCSYRLNAAGWQTAFIKDKLQFGVAPDSFHAYVSQRMRWTAGNLQSAHKFKFFLPFLNPSKATAVQRFHGWMQAIKTYFWVALIFPILVLPVLLPLLGGMSPGAELLQEQRSVRYAYLIVFIAFRLWKRLVFAPHIGSANLFNLYNNRLWITPYIVCGFYQSLTVNLEKTEFKISGTFQSPVDERSDETRQRFWKRMTDPLIMMHSIYWVFASAAFLIWFFKVCSGNVPHAYLYAGVTMRLFEIVLAASVPVQYMALPPSTVNRRGCLTKDEAGAYRVRIKTWTKRGVIGLSPRDVLESVVVIFCSWR